jgi:methylenetetrahydrofolate reductase (NADPH)
MLDPWLACLDKEGLLERVHILVGISPLRTLNLARYLNDNIPGVNIPAAVMKRLEDAGDRFQEESIAITAENIVRLRAKHGVSGVHLMPLGWEASVPMIMEKAL